MAPNFSSQQLLPTAVRGPERQNNMSSQPTRQSACLVHTLRISQLETYKNVKRGTYRNLKIVSKIPECMPIQMFLRTSEWSLKLDDTKPDVAKEVVDAVNSSQVEAMHTYVRRSRIMVHDAKRDADTRTQPFCLRLV